MNSLIIFAVFVMAAYIFQMFLGWQQLKDFNKTYTMLRKLGRVAIGRKSGRIKSGTIVMLRLMKTVGFLKLQNARSHNLSTFSKYGRLCWRRHPLF